MEELKLNHIDGKKFKPEYEEPKINSGSDPSSNLTPYNANCHCGKVTYTVHIPSLAINEVSSCNCSICTRNGYLLVYPPRKEVIFHTGYDHLSSYAFGHKRVSHKFCPTCGNSVMIDLLSMPGPMGPDQLAINVRITDIQMQSIS